MLVFLPGESTKVMTNGGKKKKKSQPASKKNYLI